MALSLPTLNSTQIDIHTPITPLFYSQDLAVTVPFTPWRVLRAGAGQSSTSSTCFDKQIEMIKGILSDFLIELVEHVIINAKWIAKAFH